MKMSKIIKEYIVEEVTKKYQPKIDALSQAIDECNNELNSLEDKAKAMAEKVALDYFNEHIRPLYPDTVDFDSKNISVYFRNVWADTTKVKDLKEKLAETIKRRDKKEKAILVELELGGTKADLDRLLSSIDPDSEE